MHKRTAHRWQLSAILMVGIAFALGSFWLVQVAQNGDNDVAVDTRKDEPDYIIEKFSFVRMTPAGAPRYIISGNTLTHHPLDDTSDIEQPIVRNIAPDQPLVNIHAQRAHLRNADNQVDLLGSVDIERPATALVKHMRIRTEALTLLPDEDIMRTALAVAIEQDATRISGVGMQADNAAQRLHIDDHAQIITPPHGTR